MELKVCLSVLMSKVAETGYGFDMKQEENTKKMERWVINAMMSNLSNFDNCVCVRVL